MSKYFSECTAEDRKNDARAGSWILPIFFLIFPVEKDHDKRILVGTSRIPLFNIQRFKRPWSSEPTKLSPNLPGHKVPPMFVQTFTSETHVLTPHAAAITITAKSVHSLYLLPPGSETKSKKHPYNGTTRTVVSLVDHPVALREREASIRPRQI